jgi:hypothetical protein
MNIFVLDLDPQLAAQYHCDKHVPKMVLESAQLLCSAHHHYGSNIENAYKPTHVNHPCAIWARTNSVNYEWLYELFYWLNIEYHYRYGKIHATGRKLLRNLMAVPSSIPLSNELTPFALAMPDAYKLGDAVASYREYYLKEKSNIAVWAHSEQPYWWNI